MANVSRSWMMIMLLSGFLVGCSTTRDVSVRTYIQDKARLDQKVEGVLGNWENSPELVDIARKPTRKVYILEFAKDDQRTITEEMIMESSPTPTPQTAYEPPPRRRRVVRKVIRKTEPEINIPSFDGMDWEEESVQTAAITNPAEVFSKEFIEHTVQKNDTLQKISKKYYQSYNKWPKIYEANRKVIDDPNNIKPGLVLRIPQ